MKKIILLMFVALIPFLTMGQKRSKKKSDVEDVTKSKKINFMIIKGVELDMTSEGKNWDEDESSEDVSLDRIMKKYLKPMTKIGFTFDMGGFNSEVEELIEASKNFRSMSQAVNKASEYGWEFVNAQVVVDGVVTIHYYYMKR